MANKSKSPPQSVRERSGRILKMAGSLAAQEIKRRVQEKLGSASASLAQLKQARTLVSELGHLKGAAMKLGQMLALEGRDYFPEEVCQILEQLHSEASFLDFPVMDEILRKELGSKYSDLSEISERPIAAASIGQVHEARLQNQRLAIKVQYPGIRDSIESDLQALSHVMKGLATLLRKDIDLTGLTHEMAQIFIQESDYLKEAEFSQEYKRLAKNLEHVVIPKVHKEYSTAQVLTMDFETGMTLTQWIRKDHPSKALREFYATQVLQLYTSEFCEWGLVQTDPNLGNFLFRPKEKQWVLLDFGATKSYDLSFRNLYSKLIVAALRNQGNEIISLGEKMKLIDPRESLETKAIFKSLLLESMRPMMSKEYDFQDDQYPQNMRKISRDLVKSLKFSPPPRDLIFLHRKLSGVFSILRTLEVKLNLKQYTEPFEALAEKEILK
jgi:aarF domain-containing kinase